MNYKRLELWNPGVLVGDVPKNVFDKLKRNCLTNFVSQRSNDRLVANIREQLVYPIEKHPEFQNFILETYNFYINEFKYPPPVDLNLYDYIVDVNDVWVNKQRKNEYNPNHIHGGFLSYVIWVQIPYNIDKELDVDYYTNDKNRLKKASFEFIYPTIGNGITAHSLWINKEDEGRIIMFPSNLMHCVYPFTTSDKIRISVAGNVIIKAGVAQR